MAGLKLVHKALSLIHYGKHRFKWKRATTAHCEYFEKYKERLPFISAAKDLLTENDILTPSVLEFGCSGGNNFRLMRELNWPVCYCGLDNQSKAIAFAQENFPEGKFYVCDDRRFPKFAPQLGSFDLFIAAAILCYLTHESAQRVLITASRLANYVLVCDDLTNFDGRTTLNDGLFMHPFGLMCRKADLRVAAGPVRSLNPGNRYGYFIAGSSKYCSRK